VTCPRPDIQEVREAIQASLLANQSAPITDVAARLYLSRSTLQRVLAENLHSFAQLRQDVRVDLAAELLAQGTSWSVTAARVGLGREYLSKRIKDRFNLRPRQIERLNFLADVTTRWRKETPATVAGRAGRPFLKERMRRWRDIENEAEELLGRLPPGPNALMLWKRRIRRQVRAPSGRDRQDQAVTRRHRTESSSTVSSRLLEACGVLASGDAPSSNHQTVAVTHVG
jgi:AraC-like DNA-binding protein